MNGEKIDRERAAQAQNSSDQLFLQHTNHTKKVLSPMTRAFPIRGTPSRHTIIVYADILDLSWH